MIADSEEKTATTGWGTTLGMSKERLKINTDSGNTEVMILMKKEGQFGAVINIKNRYVGQLVNYIYLGSKISTDGRSEAEILWCIDIERALF